MKPLVSVIIPVYNRITFLHAAIDSVLAQSYQPLEIIVVDDGSSCDVFKHLMQYHGLLTFIRKENGGLASARNFGSKRARGEFLAFLDDDDVFLPEKLDQQISILLGHPEAGLVYSDEYLLDETGRMSQVPMRAKWSPSLPSGYIAREFFMKSFIGVMTVMIRRSIFDELGGFDESLLYNEDDDLWFRIMLKYPVICSDYVSGARRLHRTNMSRNRHKMVYYQLACIQKYIVECPVFVAENIDYVKDRIRLLLKSYFRWCITGIHPPSFGVIVMNNQLRKRLRSCIAA